MQESMTIQEPNTIRADIAHQTYEKQAAAVNAQMRDELWDRIASLSDRPRQSEDALRVTREMRLLALVQPTTGRSMRFVMDEVLDLPEVDRPGPFGMGNARVTMTAWNGVRRQWVLRAIGGGALEYRWVTLPGDMLVDEAMLTDLIEGLRQGVLPPDPSETVHVAASTLPSLA